MRIHLEDPAQRPRLIAALRLQGDVIVTEIGDADLELDLLGSYSEDEMSRELERRLGTCLPAQRFTIS